MQEELRPFLAALATAGAVSTAHAVTLGDLQVESALGQRLEARVRVTAAAGETVDASCFSVMPEVPQGLTAVPGLQVALEPGGQSLRLTSKAPVQEPAAGLALRAACAGTASESVREYVMLLDPLPAGASTVVRARRGESLESLARAMVDKPGPRREYLVAMRAANPALARVGDRESLDEGTPVVLPDLRPAVRQAAAPHASAAASPRSSKPTATSTPAASRPSRPPSEELKQATAGEATAPQAAPPMPSAAAEAPAAKSAAKVPAVRATPKATPTPRVATAAPRNGGFQLKLSSGEVDLAPTSQVNDAQRKQLRERLLVLDADDQVAALLALRHSVQQLESRVAELQLKLATMPESFPTRATAPAAAPAPAAPAPVPAPSTPAATPAAKPVEATSPTPVPTASPTPAPTASPSPSPTATASSVEAPTAETKGATNAAGTPPAVESAASAPPPAGTASKESSDKRAPKPAPVKPRDGGWAESLPDWAWIAAAALALLVLWLVLRLRRRRDEAVEIPRTDLREMPPEAASRDAEGDLDLALDAPAAEPVAERPAMASDAALPTRLGTADRGNLRQRYIEERFPEVINGTILLDDADSVVKGARLFYEDGAMPRAVELLQFAIEDHPAKVKPWLALFEIFRLERLTGEYAELAGRFRQHHGNDDAWRKVRWFGHEIDPGNPLYREDAVNTLETIGPREGKRLAANMAPVDPIAENWLQAPMDFENEVLANELRNAVMGRAQLTEADLAPNPMPALRNVEMFTVA